VGWGKESREGEMGGGGKECGGERGGGRIETALGRSFQRQTL